jgi:ethanolamine kinase
MIDRDIETSTYAALCRAGIAYDYLGRFANGRIEGWLEGYVPLRCEDLSCDSTSGQIAKEMARLHCTFTVPEGELRDHHGKEVGLWDQLRGWMGQALGYDEFKTVEDTERVAALKLDEIEKEMHRIIDLHRDRENSRDNRDGIAFCHNDMLAANIMRDPQTNKIQLIDFEYGGTNYRAFDIANHFNEHAGGTTAEEGATPNYDKFPSRERQEMFCTEYVRTMKELEEQNNADEDVKREAMDLLEQVKEFVLINHLYWGLWAVNQAAEEGCEDFDYITYASNRFNEYYKRKAEWESER